jgi:tetratricopeptide (TPR) repeat protein
MKRTISLWMGLLAFALIPALAQTPGAPTGKIHGRITGPEGAPRTSGSVGLSSDGGHTNKFTFEVNANGDYAGEATPGTYSAVYRAADTPADKFVDIYENVKIVVGQDLLQDIDMSRKAFVDKLPAEQQKQLEELKKHNAEAMKANETIKHLNDDLKLAAQNFKEADEAHKTAVDMLGATASKADVEARETEIRNAKYADAETIMLRDTAAKPDASVLWAELAQAQLGLKKYDLAEVNYKKVLDLETTAKKPNPQTQATADAGLGEIYARTGKIAEAAAAYDDAAKIYPSSAGLYLKNEAVIFYQLHNAEAQAAAADKATKADPTSAIAYYLKGNGLVASATVDPKTHLPIAPAGCLEAYQMYLQLSPNGPYAPEVQQILAGFGQKIDTSYKAGKPKK